MTTIIVVEPHAILRLGIVQLLSNIEPDVSLEGFDYSCLKQTERPNRPIDLMLLSMCPSQCPEMLIDAARNSFMPKAIILLSDEATIPSGLKAIPPQVSGCVAKNVPPEVLHASIKLVLAGGTCFPPSWNRAPMREATQTPLRPEAAEVRSDGAGNEAPQGPDHARVAVEESEMLGLTPRQYEVLVLLARGYPMKMVGRHLNISVATAKAHTETLYQRLNVHNRNAAVYAAVSRGAKLGWKSIGGIPEHALD